MTKELKPYPFCGGEGQIKITHSVWNYENIAWELHCDTFGCQGSVGLAYGSEEAATESWNTRIPEIVRCGECIQFEGAECNLGMCNLEGDMVSPRDFCSFGKRKEVGVN